jgi:large subunit ribosomal protein L13
VRTFDEAMAVDATFPITHAVRGMLQHNTLGAEQLTHLRVYAGAEHKHEAQRPQPITFGELGEIIVARTS